MWSPLPIDLKYAVVKWCDVRSLLQLKACSKNTQDFFRCSPAWNTVAFAPNDFSKKRCRELVTAHTVHISMHDEDSDDLSEPSILPYIFSTCTRLEKLDLSWESIGKSSPVPASLHFLSIYRIVDVSMLQRCSQLSTLKIISDLPVKSFTFLDSLPALTHLHVGFGLQYDEVPDLEPLARLPCLTHLTLNELWNVASSELEPLSRCHNLESLSLRDLRPVRGQLDLSVLLQCKIQKLFLENCKTLRDLTPLADLPELRWLDVSQTNVQSLEPIRSCTQLQVLVLTLTAVESLEPLEACVHLWFLQIDNTRVKNLKPLAHCPKLKTLSMRETLIQDIGVLEQCRELWRVDLLNCSKSISLEPLIQCPRLTHLNYSFFHKRNIDFIACCGQLEHLSLIACPGANDNLVSLRSCVRLRIFYLRGVSRHHSDLSFLEHAPDLEYVQLGGWGFRDISGLKNCQKLSQLVLDHTLVEDISPLKSCQNLRELHVDREYPAEQIQALKLSNPCLSIID